MSGPTSLNFRFLADHDALLERYAAQAERYVFDDPNAAIIKLRMLAEALAKLASTQLGFPADGDDRFLDALRFLQRRGAYTREVGDAFHTVRKAGNRAVHHAEGDPRGALQALRLTRNIAVWYHRAFSTDHRFKPGKFVPPPKPEDASEDLEAELDALRGALAAANARAESAEETATRVSADDATRAAWAELRAALELAEEVELDHEAERVRFEAKLAELEAQLTADPEQARAALMTARAAGGDLELDEVEVRLVVDTQLRAAGWEADTPVLTAERGALPVEGRNLAIAEWPTAAGPADYVLFAGLTPLGTIEVKRSLRDLELALVESEDYARTLFRADGTPTSVPVPFAFATNGGAHIEGFSSESGIRVRAMAGGRPARSIAEWPSPADLLTRAEGEPDPIDVALELHHHVRDAVEAAMHAVDQCGQALVHIASGAGKSWAALGCVAGLLARPLDGPVLLLGHTAGGSPDGYDPSAFAHLERTGRVELRDLASFVAQSMSSEPESTARYGAIVVDECHPAALFDGPWNALPADDRVAALSHALRRMDAIRIGITATPHDGSADAFGKPVFSYCHNTAIADGRLVPHAPAIELSFEPDRVRSLDATALRGPTGARPDQSIDVRPDDVGLRVLQPTAERALAEGIARRIDPWGDSLALVLTAGPAHADELAAALRAALAERYSSGVGVEVAVVHGSPSERSRLLRHFTEGAARVVVTDHAREPAFAVPSLELLVFARPILSETDYSLALGTAARPHPGKTSFEVVHAFPRPAVLPTLAPARQTGVPEPLGSEPIWVDETVYRVSSHRRFGRDADARAHLHRFEHFVADQQDNEGFADLASGPSRSDARLVTLICSRTGFTSASLQTAAREARSVDLGLGLVAWTRAALTGVDAAAYGDRLQHALRRVLAEPGYTRVHRTRLRSIAAAYRRDGFVDPESPEVIEAGGWEALDRFLDGTLGQALDRLGAA